ncbi:hypothetical protein VSH64_45005 [Amycolatopsis rhabdoformis]|uniref:M48 family metalloprotease n=1 Tax=Amycolatopsis rhabdoformis TaxID=1448059 RepID=A0ABZ1I857_9PSEU|nr:hypothetical protein [Amycolatopsis rhabdoformis]WSE29876.1 hypothetical protein VSH64_45005 [Amycolatopsis rhabdoformis]
MHKYRPASLLGRSIAAAGALSLLALATAAPANADTAPSPADQDVTRLSQEVNDLASIVYGSSLRAADTHFDSPAGPAAAQRGFAGSDPATCTDGALVTYARGLEAQLTPTEDEAFNTLSLLGEIYAEGVETEKTAEPFGTDGQYTARAMATITKLRAFWDIDSADIQLVPWKGTDLADRRKMTKAFALGFSPLRAEQATVLTEKVLAELPVFQGGRAPLLTLNSYSVPAGSMGGRRVVLGDGELDTTRMLGADEVAVETIVGHEFGHQVNYANDNFPADESSEMGPDAYGGYFVAHTRGAAFDARLRQQVGDLNADRGSCNRGHGTPEQRRAAGQWGEDQALGQADPYAIVPSAKMIADFKVEFTEIMAG